MAMINPYRRHGGLRWRKIEDAAGTRRCLWCRAKIEPPRVTCGDKCLHEYRLRHDHKYFCDQVFIRDRGVCAKCGLDTVELFNRIVLMPEPQQADEWGKYGIPTHRRNRPPWDLDHIKEVVNGGGMCGTENAQTLCVPCHVKKTSRLATQRKLQRQLKAKPVKAQAMEDF